MEMPCYGPLDGWRHRETNGFTMNPHFAQRDAPLTVPCGQCIGCRLERSRQWAVRMVHEASCHEDNCFITLTYNDEHLPYQNTLVRSDLVKFIKRLKKNTKTAFRYYYCGEYGETTQRPHYHACLFGYKPDDPSLFSTNGEHKLYESPTLTSNWGMGHATFGELTFDTAAYTARYVTKKITGDAAEEHYRVVDDDTGEIFYRTPEFNGMSRGGKTGLGGIGSQWLKKYGKDTYDKDEVILQGRSMQPPKAYDRIFEHTDPQTWERAQAIRSARPRVERTDRQLRAASVIATSKLKLREFQ